MKSTSHSLSVAFRWLTRKPHWSAWVFALLMLAVEWSVHHSLPRALNVFAANFLLYHLFGKNGVIIAFIAIWNIGENLYDGKPIRVLDFTVVLLLLGIVGVFASLLGAAFLVGYAKDRFFKTCSTEEESLGALGLLMLALGLTAAFVGLNAWPY